MANMLRSQRRDSGFNANGNLLPKGSQRLTSWAQETTLSLRIKSVCSTSLKHTINILWADSSSVERSVRNGMAPGSIPGQSILK